LSDYDFHELSSHDFEVLVRDLLQAEWGIRIESFKTGKDRGIDLRFAQGEKQIIIQAKRFIKTGFAGLLRELAAEATKVKALRPGRYVLATSLPLSAHNKDAIVQAIGAQYLSPFDILSQSDINNLLERHPHILQATVKLWLGSKAVLDRVLNNEQHVRNRLQIEKISDNVKRYVHSSSYSKGIEVLNKERVLIISGPPGVGKTTLSDMLAYAHMNTGWEGNFIRRDITEGERIFEREKSQIFCFDDFLGATFSGERGGFFLKNEDRAIADFIALVRSSPNSRLILTTREHIWRQGIGVSERLRNAGLEVHRIVMALNEYTVRERASILYNHIYFGDLPEQYRHVLLNDEFYLEVVKHDKFNPRLIEWLSSYQRVRNIAVHEYRPFVRRLLHDPAEIWRHAYEQELTDAGRTILLALYSLGGKTHGALLHRAFEKLHKHRANKYGFRRSPGDFREGMAAVKNSFIRPVGRNDFEVLNPSVLDLMNSVAREAPENVIDGMIAAIDLSQIERLWQLSQTSRAILNSLADKSSDLAVAAKGRLSDTKRIVQYTGGEYATELTPEYKLAAITDLADKLQTPEFFELTEFAAAEMEKSWHTGRVRLNDAIMALRALEGASCKHLQQMSGLRHRMTEAIIDAASRGCRVDELREAISVIDLDDVDFPHAKDALTRAFQLVTTQFSSDLAECRTLDEHKGLLEDYEWFAETLGVDVSEQLAAIEEQIDELENAEEARADSMMDDYRERAYESRDADSELRNLFDTLRRE
jgi:DNA polymerase III delta prime subunit